MAEARAEDEDDNLREARDPVVRRNPRPNSSSSDRPDRHKPEHRLSQGPLSSIRAVIKRTSTRTSSLSEAPRERRRPEITILSAEPLAATSWFAGASGGLTPPPPPPPAAQIWGPTIPPAVQPPPSYEEVIREKTQEQVPPPTPSRRSVTTTTIATQTDSIHRGSAPRSSSPRSSAPRGSAPRGSAPDLTQSVARRPAKPPRPSFSLRVSAPLSSPGPHTHSSAHTHSEPSTQSSTHTHSQTSTHSSTNTLSEPSTRSVTHTHSCPDLLSDLISPLSSGDQTDQWEPPTPVAVTTPSDPPPDRPRPRPRPRSKASLRPISCEVKVQTLVRLRDDGQTGSEITNQEVFQGKYLQELLEAFSSDDWGFHDRRSNGSGQSESGEEEEEEEEEEDMAALRARIQAFEQQRADSNYGDSNLGNTEAPVVAKRPEPRPRAQKQAPPIAPPIAPKPQSKACWENRNPMVDAWIPQPSDSPTLTPSPAPTLTPSPAPTLTPSPAPTLTPSSAPTITPSPAPTLTPSPSAGPTPAPRPPPHRISPIDLASLPPRPPPRPPAGPRASAVMPPQDRSTLAGQVVLALPPKPSTDLQSPPSSSSFSLPKATPPRPAVTHKPSALTSDRRASAGDCSPPAPASKPGLRPPSPASKPGLRPSASAPSPAQRKTPPSKPESSSPDPPLPPRPSGVKHLPLRPPPIRASPGRPPPPQTGPANQTRGQRASRKGPPLPPRPTPGHPLFNSYMKQEQEVMVVLEDTSPSPNESLLDDKELQGSTKVITPLSDQSKPLLDLDYESEHVVHQLDQSEPVCKEKNLSELQLILPDHLSDQKNMTTPAPGSGPRCVARFDFEGADKDELTFSQGDVIALSEVIGQEWGRGQVHGRMGIFPLSFTQVVEELSPSSGKREVAQTTSELTTETKTPDHDEGEGWDVALFDFPGQTADDLSFLKGALITVTQRVDAAWSRGRLGCREGLYPSAFTHTWTAQPIAGQTMVVGVAQVLFDFSPESEDELTLKAGDLVTGVESVDEEWFIGDAGGKRGLVPKNYISLLT